MFQVELKEHQSIMGLLLNLAPLIDQAGQIIANVLSSGGKVLLCGNGGSAADAQHLATEMMVRYEQQRRPFAAIALTTDSSLLTAHTNDYDFGTLFSRQVQGLGRAGDCLIAHTGRDVGGLAPLADLAVIVPSDVTARNQEAHILIRPAWCKSVETALAAQEVQAP